MQPPNTQCVRGDGWQQELAASHNSRQSCFTTTNSSNRKATFRHLAPPSHTRKRCIYASLPADTPTCRRSTNTKRTKTKYTVRPRAGTNCTQRRWWLLSRRTSSGTTKPMKRLCQDCTTPHPASKFSVVFERLLNHSSVALNGAIDLASSETPRPPRPRSGEMA